MCKARPEVNRWFLEAMVALDSVITVKSRSLATSAVRLCCDLKHSRWVLTDSAALIKPAAELLWNKHATSEIPVSVS